MDIGFLIVVEDSEKDFQQMRPPTV